MAKSTRELRCERKPGARGVGWWYCNHCNQSWNERDVPQDWRPQECPERKHKNARMATSAPRDHKNHE
jgi:hypothetical protein